MAINLTKILNQVQDRINDSATTERDLDKLIKVADRINNSGVQVKTYGSTGQLPTISDSAYIGTIAYVSSDNVFGDSDGRFYYASGTDSGWRGFTTTQDSAEALIEVPGDDGGGGATTFLLAATSIYKAGGGVPAAPYGSNSIEKVSIASDGNSTDVGDLVTPAIGYNLGNSSTTDGFSSGGRLPAPTYGVGTTLVQIDKWPFASDTNAADTGDLNQSRGAAATNNGPTHAYQAGGQATPADRDESISKFPYAIDGGTATDVADLNPGPNGISSASGSSDATHAYIHSGYYNSPWPTATQIQRFPFATDENATDVGDMNRAGVYYAPQHQQSSTHAYQAGGYQGPPANTRIADISKFPFAASASGADAADLTVARYGAMGGSSTTHGYNMAGNNPTPAAVNTIDKYTTSSDVNATDVGDITTATQQGAGGQT